MFHQFYYVARRKNTEVMHFVTNIMLPLLLYVCRYEQITEVMKHLLLYLRASRSFLKSFLDQKSIFIRVMASIWPNFSTRRIVTEEDVPADHLLFVPHFT
jgi:hypothetical protein